MGLDMYLHKRVSRFQMNDGSLTSGKGMKFEDYYHKDDFGVSNSVELSFMVMYWRKANAIHKWFVDNVQDGNDDCKEYYVSIEQLVNLRNICMNLLKKVNKKKLYLCDNIEDSIIFDIKNLKEMYSNGRLWARDFDDDGLKSEMHETLPTHSGFFFGETDYNGGYLRDLVKTVLMIDNLLVDFKKIPKKDEYRFKKNAEVYDLYYHASW